VKVVIEVSNVNASARVRDCTEIVACCREFFLRSAFIFKLALSTYKQQRFKVMINAQKE
jgi:hypothetical protein